MPRESPVRVSCGVLGGGAHRLGDAEIADDRVALGKQDVLGLDVAVQDPHAVGVGQRVGDRAGDGQRLLGAQVALVHAGAGGASHR